MVGPSIDVHAVRPFPSRCALRTTCWLAPLHCLLAYCLLAYCLLAYCLLAYCLLAYCLLAFCLLSFGLLAYCLLAYCLLAYCLLAYCLLAYCLLAYCLLADCPLAYCLLAYCLLPIAHCPWVEPLKAICGSCDGVCSVLPAPLWAVVSGGVAIVGILALLVALRQVRARAHAHECVFSLIGCVQRAVNGMAVVVVEQPSWPLSCVCWLCL